MKILFSLILGSLFLSSCATPLCLFNCGDKEISNYGRCPTPTPTPIPTRSE
mgnify:FL=1